MNAKRHRRPRRTLALDGGLQERDRSGEQAARSRSRAGAGVRRGGRSGGRRGSAPGTDAAAPIANATQSIPPGTCPTTPAAPTKTPTSRLVPTARTGSSPTKPQQRGHSQRAEDQADDAAEEADHRATGDRSRDVELLPPADRATGPEQVNAERDQQDADHDQQRRPRQLSRDESAEDSPHNRRRRHPAEHTPVDPAGAHLSDGSRSRRDAGRHRCSRRLRRRGSEEMSSIAGRRMFPEHETDEPTCEARSRSTMPRRRRARARAGPRGLNTTMVARLRLAPVGKPCFPHEPLLHRSGEPPGSPSPSPHGPEAGP